MMDLWPWRCPTKQRIEGAALHSSLGNTKHRSQYVVDSLKFFFVFFFLTTNFVLFFPPHLMMTFWLFMRLNPSIRRFSRSSLNATAARYVCERNISMARLWTNTREHNELANKDASLRWWWLVLLSRQRNHFFSSREWKSKENLGFLEVKSRCQSSVEEFSGRADNRWEIFESS